MSTFTRDVLLQTPDLEAASSFYHQVLGLTPFLHHADLVGFDAGAFRLFLDRGPAYGPVFEIVVTGLATAKQRLQQAGCAIEQDDPSIPRCYVRDPFGMAFNVTEREPAV